MSLETRVQRLEQQQPTGADFDEAVMVVTWDDELPTYFIDGAEVTAEEFTRRAGPDFQESAQVVANWD